MTMPTAGTALAGTQLRTKIQDVAASEGLILTDEDLISLSEMFGHFLRARRHEQTRQENYRSSYKTRLKVMRSLQKSSKEFFQWLQEAADHPYVGPELMAALGMTNQLEDVDRRLVELNNQVILLRQAIETLTGAQPAGFDRPEFTRGTPAKHPAEDLLIQQLNHLLMQILERSEHSTTQPSFLEVTGVTAAFLKEIADIDNSSKTVSNVAPQNTAPSTMTMQPLSSDGIYDNEPDELGSHRLV